MPGVSKVLGKPGANQSEAIHYSLKLPALQRMRFQQCIANQQERWQGKGALCKENLQTRYPRLKRYGGRGDPEVGRQWLQRRKILNEAIRIIVQTR